MIFGGFPTNEDGAHKPNTNAMSYTIQNYFLTQAGSYPHPP
jgi:hypothetical protein